jgi:hypothetical protein
VLSFLFLLIVFFLKRRNKNPLKSQKKKTMLSVVVAALLGLAAARDCQYVMYEDSLVGLYLPLGINRCHYYITSSVQQSMQFTCVSETQVRLDSYDKTFDCTGSHNSTTYTSSEMTFDCSTDRSECGKLFGFKTPCDCTKEDGNCDYAFAYSIVDDTCVPYSSLVSNTYYQEWDITCGSVSKAKAEYTVYTDSACNSEYFNDATSAGCRTNSDYSTIFGNDEVDWIVCPANIHTFSITMIVALIVAALSM